MSGIGNPKVDARGRSGPRKTNGAMQIAGQWIPRRYDMLISPAYRVLSLSAHRVLARVEIEHCQHGGAENGALKVTFDNFAEYGIERHCIGPAIRETCALGFHRLVHRGRAGIGEFRSSNVFRITYLSLKGVKPTDDWEAITEEEAKEIARTARAAGGLRRSLRARPPAAPVGHKQQDIEGSGFSTLANIVHSSGIFPLKPRPISGETRTGGREKPPLVNEIRGRA